MLTDEEKKELDKAHYININAFFAGSAITLLVALGIAAGLWWIHEQGALKRQDYILSQCNEFGVFVIKIGKTLGRYQCIAKKFEPVDKDA